jgi:hypothetical protein
MRRLARHLFTLCSAASLLLCVAVCVLWVRGRTGYDEAAWTYDRYLLDRSAATNHVQLTSDKRLWLDVNWGRVGPYNGQLVWGYYMNADRSGGRPRHWFRHERYDAIPAWGFLKLDVDDGATGWGPLRWQSASRSKAKDGDDFRYIRIGLSHWLLALLSLVLPIVWLNRFRKARRARTLGLCPTCANDLRATPQRCPECGAVFI